jgi:hypothetical protein
VGHSNTYKSLAFLTLTIIFLLAYIGSSSPHASLAATEQPTNIAAPTLETTVTSTQTLEATLHADSDLPSVDIRNKTWPSDIEKVVAIEIINKFIGAIPRYKRSDPKSVYVLDVDLQEEITQRCNYAPAGRITRIRISIQVDIVERNTGSVFASKTFWGLAPESCPQQAKIYQMGTWRGDPPLGTELKSWLREVIPPDSSLPSTESVTLTATDSNPSATQANLIEPLSARWVSESIIYTTASGTTETFVVVFVVSEDHRQITVISIVDGKQSTWVYSNTHEIQENSFTATITVGYKKDIMLKGVFVAEDELEGSFTLDNISVEWTARPVAS